MPSLCSTFKGQLPHELYLKYNEENGYERMQFDMEVAREISERITEQHEAAKSGRKSPTDARSAVARRNQRRAERVEGKDLSDMIGKWASD